MHKQNLFKLHIYFKKTIRTNFPFGNDFSGYTLGVEKRNQGSLPQSHVKSIHMKYDNTYNYENDYYYSISYASYEYCEQYD